MCNRSLTEMSGRYKWHTSDQLILCQRDSSFSHGGGLTECLWTGVQSCCFPFSSLSSSFFFTLLFVYLISSPFSVSTHTHARKQFQLNFSNKKETLLALSIYHGWNVLGDKVPLNLSLFNILHEKILNLMFHTAYSFFFARQRGLYFLIGIIPLYSDPYSMDLNFLPSSVSLNNYPATFHSWKSASHWGAVFNWLIVHMVGIFTGIATGKISSHQKLLVEHLRSEASNWIDGVLIDA